jgi:HAMP domain-containing protein
MNKKSKASKAGNGVAVLARPKAPKKKIKVALAEKTNGNGNGHHHEDVSGLLDNRELLRVLTEVRNGNFTARMPFDQVGMSGKICDTLNDIISLNEKMVQEFMRAGNTIGKQGKLTQRIQVPDSKGSWSTGVDSLNVLISDLVHPTIEIAHVISSVAKGNLSQEMPQEIGGHVLQGEFARIAKEVNDMVKQLNLFSMEVTRVAREVGSEGKLGGQAKVKGVGRRCPLHAAGALPRVRRHRRGHAQVPPQPVHQQ